MSLKSNPLSPPARREVGRLVLFPSFYSDKNRAAFFLSCAVSNTGVVSGCTMNAQGDLPSLKAHFCTSHGAEGVRDSILGVRSAHSGMLRGAGPCEDTGSAHSGTWGEAGPCEDTGCPSPHPP